LSLLALGPAAGSSLWTEQAKLISPDWELDNFGNSVALSGGIALVGVPGWSLVDNGAVNVFSWNGSQWTERATLTPSDANSFDSFGYSVALDGRTALIGSRWDDVGGIITAGSAFVFRLEEGTWVEQAKLTASDAEEFDEFGWSVAISGTTAWVGARSDDIGGLQDAGSAYVFRWDGSQWVEEAKLTASDGDVVDWFGWSVAISGNTALVGAYGDGVGSAFVYRWDGTQWIEQAKLSPSSPLANSFGWSVALDGNTALVGDTFYDDGSGTLLGAAHVFRWNGATWVEEAVLTASDGEANDQLGYSVALSGNTALVGSRNDDVEGVVDAGSAYVWQWDGSQWVEQPKLVASDGLALDRFGHSVALSGRNALVGAVASDEGGLFDAGSAYVFRWEP
jgi:hypothetical protein